MLTFGNVGLEKSDRHRSHPVAAYTVNRMLTIVNAL